MNRFKELLSKLKDYKREGYKYIAIDEMDNILGVTFDYKEVKNLILEDWRKAEGLSNYAFGYTNKGQLFNDLMKEEKGYKIVVFTKYISEWVAKEANEDNAEDLGLVLDRLEAYEEDEEEEF